MEEIDEFAEWEDGEVACRDNSYGRDEDEQGFEDGEFLGEEIQAEVDEDEIL